MVYNYHKICLLSDPLPTDFELRTLDDILNKYNRISSTIFILDRFNRLLEERASDIRELRSLNAPFGVSISVRGKDKDFISELDIAMCAYEKSAYLLYIDDPDKSILYEKTRVQTILRRFDVPEIRLIPKEEWE